MPRYQCDGTHFKKLFIPIWFCLFAVMLQLSFNTGVSFNQDNQVVMGTIIEISVLNVS